MLFGGGIIMKFYAYRYFLVENNQKGMFDNNNRKEVLEKSIDELKKKYLYTELYKNTHLLKLGKQKETTLYHPDKKDIHKINDVENYPYVNILFNINYQEQIILIEKNSTVFKDTKISAKKLEKMLSENFKRLGYTLKIEAITFTKSFWECVKGAKVYDVMISLNSPNLFGATKKINQELKDMEKQFNNDEFQYKLSNKDGDLIIDPIGIGPSIDYISDGGGSWAVRRKIGSEEKVTISSKCEKNIKNVEIDLENDDKDSMQSKIIPIARYYERKKNE